MCLPVYFNACRHDDSGAVAAVFLGSSEPIALFYGPMAIWATVFTAFAVERATRASGLSSRIINVPILKEFIRPFILGNTLLVMGACGKAGMLWPRALEVAAESSGNRIARNRLQTAAKDLRDQRLQNVTEAMIAIDAPRSVVNLVEVGETSGDLDQRLTQAAAVQREQFRNRLTWAMKILVSVIYTIALVIAVIAIVSMFYALYAPVFDMLDM